MTFLNTIIQFYTIAYNYYSLRCRWLLILLLPLVTIAKYYHLQLFGVGLLARHRQVCVLRLTFQITDLRLPLLQLVYVARR